jgi:phosphoribosylglycinamide formyltransferase-1
MPAARGGKKGRPRRRPIGVLISKRGSNLMAILDRIDSGELDARVAIVICNRPKAPGAAAAAARGVETLILDHRDSPTREAHDRLMAEALEASRVELVCLAGYMRILSPWFIRRFPNRVINIHPSLLPAFPGVTAQRDALEHGVRVTGCTVHFVDETMDTGPIIMQAAVPVRDDDSVESLAARILKEEHRIYSEAIALLLAGRLKIVGRRVICAGGRGRR